MLVREVDRRVASEVEVESRDWMEVSEMKIIKVGG